MIFFVVTIAIIIGDTYVRYLAYKALAETKRAKMRDLGINVEAVDREYQDHLKGIKKVVVAEHHDDHHEVKA